MNETAYDFLEGVAMRRRHKTYPEPEVAMIFKKEPTDNSIDLTEVESSLQKAIKQASLLKHHKHNTHKHMHNVHTQTHNIHK